MAKISITIFINTIIISLILSGVVLAKDFSLPDIHLTPDSPFYFLKAWKEQTQLFFAFGLENKAKQYLHLADIRLVEYQKMVEKGKTEVAQKTLEKYEKHLNHAIDKINELKQKGKDIQDVEQKLEETTSKHLEVLQKNLEKAPEQAKKGLENAIKNSQKQIDKGLNLAPSEVEEGDTYRDEKYDSFAKCLSEKGVKIYGSSWCPHCINQKNMFESSWKYINYIECALPEGGQAPICQQSGIRAYPTWEFQEGKRIEGELSFEQLSQYSNCKLDN